MADTVTAAMHDSEARARWHLEIGYPAAGDAAQAHAGHRFDDPDADDEEYGEPSCLVCGGQGMVEGRDHLDWDEDGYDDLIQCTSCRGSGLAKDMTWC